MPTGSTNALMTGYGHHMRYIFWILIAALFFLLCATRAGHAQKYHGAIAYSQSQESWGWFNSGRSRKQAEREALKECAVNADDCQIVVWVYKQCAALAIGDNSDWGTGWSRNKKRAVSKALKDCAKHTTNCTWQQSICTAIPRRRSRRRRYKRPYRAPGGMYGRSRPCAVGVC